MPSITSSIEARMADQRKMQLAPLRRPSIAATPPKHCTNGTTPNGTQQQPTAAAIDTASSLEAFGADVSSNVTLQALAAKLGANHLAAAAPACPCACGP